MVLKSGASKVALIVVEVAAFLAATLWIGKVYWADHLAQTPTQKTFGRAARLDPSDADYRMKLGRMYQYSLTEIEPELALQQFRQAIELSPMDAQAWLDLGAALELQGKTTEAEAALRRADFLAPHLPGFQWAIGNFFLLHGNTDEAFKHFAGVLAGTDRYNGVIFNMAWKASGDANKILNEVIPPNVATEFSYLGYLVGAQHLPEAHQVWQRIAQSSARFSPRQAAGYIDSLNAARQPAEAYQVWQDLMRKGLIPGANASSGGNLIFNGDFEQPPLNMGFDWRIGDVAGAETSLDDAMFHSGAHAARIEFDGKLNVGYWHLYQFVKVEPGHSYRLRAFVKAEGITTDSGPRLEVRDAYDSRLLDRGSESITGSTEGWSPVSIDFSTGPKTELVMVDVIRPQSQRIDNQIAGKFWVDDVTLTAAEAERR
jgi:tetratricopeptide (TPR) repeat protein